MDLVSVIEAAYRIENGPKDWLPGVLRAVRPVLDFGLGLCAYAYDARVPGAFRAEPMISVGIRSSRFRDRVSASLPHLDASYVERSYLTQTCQRATRTLDTPELRDLLRYLLAPTGAIDSLVVNALDPSGIGIYVGALLPPGAVITARRRATWSRIAAHVAAGHRLLRRQEDPSAPEDVEARLSRSGKVEDTRGAADCDEARRQLAGAAQALERSRGRERQHAPEQAVARWRGLVAARWTLIEDFEAGGRRYLLARRNDPVTAAPPALSVRERQALALARLQHSNKLIAYELGISSSTVGVLLHRAAAKLGARSRKELLDRAREIGLTEPDKVPR